MVEKESVKQGLIAGFIATLCCSLPLVLLALAVFFGIGSVTLGLYIGYYGEGFLVIGLGFLAASTYFSLKKTNSCSIEGAKQHWKTIAFSLLIMFGVYFIVKFTVVPYFADMMFGGL